MHVLKNYFTDFCTPSTSFWIFFDSDDVACLLPGALENGKFYRLSLEVPGLSMHCSLLHHGVVPTAKASEHKHLSVSMICWRQPVLAFQTLDNRPGKKWQRMAKGHWSIESCIQRVLLQRVLERVTPIVKPVPRDRSPGELWAAMAFKRGHTAQHLCNSCKGRFFACFINFVHWCSLFSSAKFSVPFAHMQSKTCLQREKWRNSMCDCMRSVHISPHPLNRIKNLNLTHTTSHAKAKLELTRLVMHGRQRGLHRLNSGQWSHGQENWLQKASIVESAPCSLPTMNQSYRKRRSECSQHATTKHCARDAFSHFNVEVKWNKLLP